MTPETSTELTGKHPPCTWAPAGGRWERVDASPPPS